MTTHRTQPGDPLTERQAALLRFVIDSEREHGRPVTIRDICQRFGIAINAVSGHLKALQKKGFIVREAGARNIRVLKEPDGASAGSRVQLTRDEIANALKACGMDGVARALVVPFLCDRWGVS